MSEGLIDKPVIVNWALAELGLPPSFSTDDQTQLGRNVNIFWPRAVARCFALHDWTFARQTFPLARLAEQPVTGYSYGFTLPNRIGEPMKLLSDPRDESPIRESRIEGNTLFADEPAVWAVCKVETDPAIWDPAFADAFAIVLAAYLAIPLTADADSRTAMLREAFGTPSEGGTGGMFGRLLAQNKAAHPVASPIDRFDPLSASRW
ncbi:hypothetical protein JYU29_04970 [Tianweitania sp. BSSL-BM11]|uniref:Uncharacterized protein n=1 Tax=Tianweitania aestuarii TaxID=2814886 RepID=A0ABS5RSL2_9HYPH|nr:hypothetical protein [Tianweitania aestuarii]MBS9720039.1 hypothetical protein [Tianweitania aestuarii]